MAGKGKEFRDGISAKTLSVLCSAVMAFGMTPAAAFADTAGNDAGGGSQTAAAEAEPQEVEAQLTFSVSDGAATVTGLSNRDDATVVDIPATYEQDGVSYPVTKIGDDAFAMCANVVRVSISEGVTTIGQHAFNFDSKIESVSIPSTATNIGKGAFQACRALTSVTLPAGMTSVSDSLFSNCAALKSVVVPDGVTTIGNGAFSASGLESVSLPESLTTIEKRAFSGASLSSIQIPSKVTTIGESAFQGCNFATVTIPDQVTTIGTRAFYRCDKLTAVSVPDSVISLGERAFEDCTSLVSARVGKGVSTLDGNQFHGCSSLTYLVLADGVKSLGWSAIYGLSNLRSLIVPASVTSIDRSTFGGCGSASLVVTVQPGSYAETFVKANNVSYVVAGQEPELAVTTSELTLTEGRPYSVGLSASRADATFAVKGLPEGLSMNMAGVITGTATTQGTYQLEVTASVGDKQSTARVQLSVVAPPVNVAAQLTYKVEGGEATVTGVSNPEQATYADIPATYTAEDGQTYPVTAVGDNAFVDCYWADRLTLPEGLKKIGDQAFSGLTHLSSVTLPGTLSSIGNRAFYNCTGLQTVVIEQGVTTIPKRTFEGCSGLQSVTIPTSVTKVEDGNYGNKGAFEGCPNDMVITCSRGSAADTYAKKFGFGVNYVKAPEAVAELTYDVADGKATVTGATNKATTNTVRVPATTADGAAVTAVGDEALRWATLLETVEVADGVTTIGANAFANCNLLSDVTLPDSVTILGSQVFANDPELASIALPASLAAVPDYAFYNDTALTSVSVPDKATSIGASAFSGCSALATATIPASVTTIADDAFDGCASGLTIRCYKGSAADTFAQAHSLAVEYLDAAAPTVERVFGQEAVDTAAAIAAKAYPQGSGAVVIATNASYYDALSAAALAGTLKAPILLTDASSLSQATAAEVASLGAKQAYVVGGEVAVTPQVATDLAAAGLTVERVSGQTAADTSLECAKKAVELGGSSERAIVASPASFADALSASSWAYSAGVPIVIEGEGATAADRSLSADAKTFLAGKQVTVLGGTGAVSDESVAGLNVAERLWGQTAYDTSNAIAEALVADGRLSAGTLVVATGAAQANGLDALAGAALAGVDKAPIVLTSGNAALEAEDWTAIDGYAASHKGSISQAYVLGGEFVMPQGALDKVASAIGADQAEESAE